MIARAGGPTLRLSTRMLSVALHVAAWDKRINDEAWRGLDLGRKELLLPLGDDARLREAAQHVAERHRRLGDGHRHQRARRRRDLLARRRAEPRPLGVDAGSRAGGRVGTQAAMSIGV